jgi:4-hydroxy-tetrahydrodipicolinate synthase
MSSRATSAPATESLHDFVIPLVTPFTSGLDLDLDALRHNVRHTLAIPGCGAVYVGSVYQEFWTLTVSERIELLETVSDEVDGRVPIVAGISSASLREAIELAHAAERAGATLLMLWPPLWGPRDATGVKRFYECVTDHTSMPLFIYSTTLHELGFYLDPHMVEELADAIPTIVGVKDGSGNVSTFLSLTEHLGDRLAIGTPFEEYWALARAAYPDRACDFLFGASRPMYMQTQSRPYLADVLGLVRAGRHEDAFRTLAAVRELVALQMESFRRGVHPVSLVKYACYLLGQCGAEVRPPTPALSGSDRRGLEEALRKSGLLSPEGAASSPFGSTALS